MIFLGGIHGVGKTTLLTSIKQSFEISVYSASELIARKKNSEYIQNKNRTDITGDQSILLYAVKEFISEEKCILDGHFCLLDADGKVNRIPKDIFNKLPIRKIFILVADASEIIQRLANRDNKQYSDEQIRLFQEVEVKYAQEIAKDKNVEFEVIYNERNILKYLQEL